MGIRPQKYKLTEVDDATMQAWRDAHSRVKSGIESIPPKFIKPKLQHGCVEDLPIENIMQYAQIEFEDCLKAELEIAEYLKGKLPAGQKLLQLGPSFYGTG